MHSESYSVQSKNTCLLYYVIGHHIYDNLETKQKFTDNDCLFMGWYIYHNYINL